MKNPKAPKWLYALILIIVAAMTQSARLLHIDRYLRTDQIHIISVIFACVIIGVAAEYIHRKRNRRSEQ